MSAYFLKYLYNKHSQTLQREYVSDTLHPMGDLKEETEQLSLRFREWKHKRSLTLYFHIVQDDYTDTIRIRGER